MFKPINIIGITLFFILGLSSFAFSEESITITTYYPSPYGSYNDLYVANKVGIGTTDPASLLHLQSTGSPVLTLQGANTDTDYGGILFNTGGFDRAAIQGGRFSSTGDFRGQLQFFTKTAGNNWGERMRIDPDGKVGIGTAAPGAHLDVDASDNAEALRLRGSNVTGEGPKIAYFYGGTVSSQIQSIRAGNHFADLAFSNYRFGGPLTEYMRLTSTGNLGIGTASPGYKLDVAGDAHFTSHSDSSDIRFKRNIKPIGRVLDKLANIRGVYFEWNDTYKSLGRATQGRQIGIIAQEIEKEFPELVSTWGDGSEYRGLNYDRFTAVLLEAIKEQQKEINVLKEELAQQKAKIASLK